MDLVLPGMFRDTVIFRNTKNYPNCAHHARLSKKRDIKKSMSWIWNIVSIIGTPFFFGTLKILLRVWTHVAKKILTRIAICIPRTLSSKKRDI